jgi:hypothetical protein
MRSRPRFMMGRISNPPHWRPGTIIRLGIPERAIPNSIGDGRIGACDGWDSPSGFNGAVCPRSERQVESLGCRRSDHPKRTHRLKALRQTNVAGEAAGFSANPDLAGIRLRPGRPAALGGCPGRVEIWRMASRKWCWSKTARGVPRLRTERTPPTRHPGHLSRDPASSPRRRQFAAPQSQRDPGSSPGRRGRVKGICGRNSEGRQHEARPSGVSRFGAWRAENDADREPARGVLRV